MIKFDTINGQLCIMLEQPIPLTEDAKFPCAVRLIQDDSPMGRYNNRLTDKCLLPFICVGIDNKGDMERMGNAPRFGHECYETIGYPVVPNSAEWRNYQLMQGKCVCCPGDSEYYQASGQGRIIGRLIENNEFNSTWNSDTFMRDDSDGWQLYKPKPEVASPLENGFYAVRTVDPVPIILEWYQGKWIWPDGTMREFEFTSDITSYMLVERNQWLIDTPLSGVKQQPKPAPVFKVGDCKIEFVKQELKNLLDKI